MNRSFDVTAVEEKWQARWLDDGTYEVDNDDPRERYYALCMYPYPSGSAHQGHVRNYTFGDLVVRYQTMLGKAVLSPYGFDSVGLPAENAAIKAGSHPRLYTEARMHELKTSVRRLGAVYDWRREVYSHDPEYMKWSQMIFLAFLKNGLAFRAEAQVNWCPSCMTVLANEQVVPDEDERDFEFAKVHGLSVVRTVQPPAGFDGDAYTGDGEHVNSGFLDGLDAVSYTHLTLPTIYSV